jgi:serine phosphatase RsbU (regulator of sigma subunit)
MLNDYPGVKIVLKSAVAFLLFMIISSPFAYGAEPVIIDKNLTRKSIGINLEYLEDKNKNINSDEIISGGAAGKFEWIKSDRETLGFGFKKAVYWVRFSITNRLGKDAEFLLHQEYPHIDYLELYVPDRNGRYGVIKTGCIYKFSQRPVEYKNFIFPLSITAGKTSTLFLRYDTTGSINIELSVLTRDAFSEIKDSEAIFYWMFYGICLVMFIYNLFIFLATRDRSYFYYIVYIASFAMFTMSLNGMAYQYLWPGNEHIGKMPIAITMSLIIISIIQFARGFINVKMHSVIWENILKILVIISLALLILSLSIKNYFFSITSTNILAGVSAFIGSIGVIKFVIVNKSRQAKYFTGSFLLFLLGVILVVLQHRGILPSNVLTKNGIMIGAVFQVVTLSFGLADRINTMRKELKVLNIGLEKKVAERTGELQAAYEELEAMNQNLLETRDALWGEMQIAKRIQTVLLPEDPEIPGYEISAHMTPAAEVGGDYYDIINIEGRNWIIIGDVSGHGVPAGLIMMMTQSSIQTVLRENPSIQPSLLLDAANRTIAYNSRQMGEDKYVTITALDLKDDGRVVYSGLHQDIFVYRSAEDRVEIIETDGLWLGFENDLGRINTDKEFTMNHGDAMLLYTDGITEAIEKNSRDINPMSRGKMFGDKRLSDIFRESGRQSTESIMDRILAGLDNYECPDDVTLLVVKRG